MNNTIDFRDMDFDEIYLDDEIEDDDDEDIELEDSLFEVDRNGESKWKELSYYRYNQNILDN